PHITTNPHELALTVLFESGLQHIADRPESLLAQPQEVKDFFSELPAAWDETKFVCGYPGEYVVLARRKGTTWYIAGINGKDDGQNIAINIDFIEQASDIQAFFDDDKNGWKIEHLEQLPQNIACMARGGFLIVIR
ncbi:MAG: glycoside hydrolase family 97 C-terminal domain-containing protein, partial [Marinilabiliaceae bacterium]|nr:glycoside hydrolase family 97 C-terminal domain-containing protein [Marinilabiliaceae bacterium]